MPRPPEFEHPYFTVRHTPYQIIAESSGVPGRPPSGGVMKTGQLLWTQQRVSADGRQSPVLAFADGIGTVTVDPRLLKLADAVSN